MINPKKLVLTLSLLTMILMTGCIHLYGIKNIAFRRAVYQSSAINFNSTGHLITDGIYTVNKYGSISQNQQLDSRWVSKTNRDEWVYVDLGTQSKIENIKLYWDTENFATQYEIQVSDDAKEWKTIFSQQKGDGGTALCPVKNTETARFVRLNCISGKWSNFSLIEMEVSGSNNIDHKPEAVPAPSSNGTQYLTGGNWRIQRASEVPVQDGKKLSLSGFNDAGWLPATVPGTVLMSYLKAGAIPDPNYGEQQRLVSDSYFTADFWYRNKFEIPSSQKGKITWLNFNAVNWKADVFFNGTYLGRIDGAFIRGQFNITDYVKWGKDNYLAVLVHKNDTPGEVTIQTKGNPGHNGGLLGADNPTIHASIGWDWLPTIRGRNIGIYDDVFISYTQDVQLLNPWITVDLDTGKKDFSKAYLSVKTEVRNSSDKKQEVFVKGKIQPSGLDFQSPVFTLEPGETRELSVADLTMVNPRLWWPNTYGEQFLYTAQLEAVTGDRLSDSIGFKFGVREFTYDTNRPLTIYCNGTRIVCRGGNWGMDDGNLAATSDDYDIKIKMHAEANLTMIRNWVGMTRKDAFYHACDKYGILIWDDFWLANPGDGPDPDNEVMFMHNAIDKVKRNRHYASVALYCGRNEGNPPESLNKDLALSTERLDGTRTYISHSANGAVSGWGPYAVQDREWYFENTFPTIHSERGMPNIPAYESLARMLPPENHWPVDDVWGIHDFTMEGAQHGKKFLEEMNRYGTYNDLKSFSRVAQMVNYIGHKGIFEPVYTNNSNGMLMWMSQSSWPSMVWQTYDYYYDTNAGYFAVKQANQPVNLIYNPSTQDFVLTNNTTEDKDGLNIVIRLFDLNGKLLKESVFVKSAVADSRSIISKLELKELSGLIFIKSGIYEKGRIIADNFTWIDADGKKDYTKLSEIPQAKLKGNSGPADNGYYKITVTNEGDSPALLIRIKAIDTQSQGQILPVYFSDNYFSLMPGESKEISIELHNKAIGQEDVSFRIEGWNISGQNL